MKQHKDNLTNHGGVLCFKENGTVYHLGYLLHHDGSTFCPSTGRWSGISPEDKDAHNQALSNAEIEGLDARCDIGQGGTLYYVETDKAVKTFVGTIVSKNVSIKGNSITFVRRGKTYRGRLQKDADCFNFTRIS